MKKHLGKIVAVILGAVGVVVMFLRGVFDTRSLKHEAAKLDVEKKAADVEAKKDDVKAAEAQAEETKASVEKRLAEIDRYIAEEHARDSVDVANDLIKG